MTLNTRVYLTSSITPDALFAHAVAALTAADGHELPAREVLTERIGKGAIPPWATRTPDPAYWAEPVSHIRSEMGQGLPGIVDVHFDPDGPLQPAPSTHEEDGQDIPAHDLAVSFNTAYSYSRDGDGPADLHAAALRELRHRLPDGAALAWRNEFTGAVHDGVAEQDLSGLIREGLNAGEWFTEVRAALAGQNANAIVSASLTPITQPATSAQRAGVTLR